MSMSAIKSAARAAIHANGSEPCTHERDGVVSPSAEQSAEGLSLSVRFKSKLKTASAESDGVAILENVESLIFIQSQLDALAITLEHGDLIAIPGYGIVFELDQEMDPDGPLQVYWTVVRAS